MWKSEIVNELSQGGYFDWCVIPRTVCKHA